jgi:hypothetical protein
MSMVDEKMRSIRELYTNLMSQSIRQIRASIKRANKPVVESRPAPKAKDHAPAVGEHDGIDTVNDIRSEVASHKHIVFSDPDKQSEIMEIVSRNATKFDRCLARRKSLDKQLAATESERFKHELTKEVQRLLDAKQ